MSEKIRVGLLFGGRSGEHEVSLASAASVYRALDKSKYEITPIGIDKSGQWSLTDPAFFLSGDGDPMRRHLIRGENAIGLRPYPTDRPLVSFDASPGKIPAVDVVLPILHGTFGEDGTVQGLLELAQIPYVGSGVLGSAVGMDKDVAGRLLKEAGIPTVPTTCVRRHEYDADAAGLIARLTKTYAYPFFVKPANAGSSVGVHKVKTAEEIAPALADAFAFDTKVLVQKGVAARELEVSVLGNDHPRASIVGEIVPRRDFYDYEAKYLDANGAELCIPARDLTAAQSDRIRTLATRAFLTLEARGLARVDFFMDKQTGEIYLNEINTLPGFTSVSMYPKLWEATGLKYSDLLDRLIELAFQHAAERRGLKTSF